MARTIRETLIARVQKDPNECWEWDGHLSPIGYGQVGFEGRVWAIHRLFHTWFNGPIPAGLKVLHRCDNRKCCNPAHLFVGTQQENLEDMRRKGRHWRAKATHCRRGHEYTPENTRQYPSHGNARICRTCETAGKAGRLKNRINFPDRYPRNKALTGRRPLGIAWG